MVVTRVTIVNIGEEHCLGDGSASSIWAVHSENVAQWERLMAVLVRASSALVKGPSNDPIAFVTVHVLGLINALVDIFVRESRVVGRAAITAGGVSTKIKVRSGTLIDELVDLDSFESRDANIHAVH